MTVLLGLCAAGLLSGFLLMTRVPLCEPVGHSDREPSPQPRVESTQTTVAIVIPARDEEQTLPRLLASIPSPGPLAEVVVVDDNSADRTAEIAAKFGARVIGAGTLPQGFTGKAWACTRGAQSASAGLLLFLDADTWFEREGLARILRMHRRAAEATALSVLPFATTQRPYEDLSLFFNLLMAFGAGGFGAFRTARLFGQSLLLSRQLYERLGSHAAVGSRVLENFHLSNHLKAAGGRSLCLGGRGTLSMRMFPAGFRQLADGWTKAFADGAHGTDPRILWVSICWLSTLATIPIVLMLAAPHMRVVAILFYLLAAAQVAFFARQVGSFRLLSCLLYPLPLVFFFLIFARSATRRARHQTTNWRGRNV